MTVPKEIYDLIQNSGNNFHAKVARWFIDHGWHVTVSPYYMDQAQSKAREIDLVAEKLWPIYDRFDNPSESVAVRLFIECKFVTTETVFWFANKDLESTLSLICSQGPFRRGNSYVSDHHYMAQGSKRVAKIFATRNDRNSENEPFYKALNQSLSAMTSMRGRPIMIPAIRKVREHPLALLEFPVVVCSSFDKIYRVDFDVESAPSPISENFQLEVSYAYIDRSQNQRNDYFLLDFVAFDKLTEFAVAVGNGASAAALLAAP